MADLTPTPPANRDLADFANDLLAAWNIEDTNEPSLTEQFLDMFHARFDPVSGVFPTPSGDDYDTAWWALTGRDDPWGGCNSKPAVERIAAAIATARAVPATPKGDPEALASLLQKYTGASTWLEYADKVLAGLAVTPNGEQAALAAILELHEDQPSGFCLECQRTYPCDTVLAASYRATTSAELDPLPYKHPDLPDDRESRGMRYSYPIRFTSGMAKFLPRAEFEQDQSKYRAATTPEPVDPNDCPKCHHPVSIHGERWGCMAEIGDGGSGSVADITFCKCRAATTEQGGN